MRWANDKRPERWRQKQRTLTLFRGQGSSKNCLVREEGLEPSRPFGHRNLNPARLPIPPLARVEHQMVPDHLMLGS